VEAVTATQDTANPSDQASSADASAVPLSAGPETPPGQGADTADTHTPDASSPDTPVDDPVDRPIVEDGPAPTAPPETANPAEEPSNADESAAPLSAVPETLPGQGADTADTHTPDVSSSDTAPGTDQPTARQSPYTMRALFEEHTLSDFADHQTRSPDGLPTTGQDVAPPNAEFSAGPADSADADAWNQLPKQVRDSFQGEVRMEEFHDGIGRIVDPDSSIDGGYWYRDGDAAENEETWRRDDAVLGQWNSGSSYVHLDGSEAPIKGWVGTTRGQSTLDGGWLPGGKEGIYIPRSEMFKLRDASVSGGKVPWRS